MSFEERSHFGLVAGLGNPGREYAFTRHNAGFLILDRLAEKLGYAFRAASRWQSQVAGRAGLLLCKPQTYMNCSGPAVSGLASYHRVSPGGVLVVYDDAALPFGQLRLRADGSAGGHRGMQSVIDALGSSAVPRLRFGIGSGSEPGGGGLTPHVLGAFRGEEAEALDAHIDRAVEAILCACREGVEQAMNRFNRGAASGQPNPETPPGGAKTDRPETRNNQPTRQPGNRSNDRPPDPHPNPGRE